MPIGTTALSSSSPPDVTALASGDGCGVESGEDVDGGAAMGWIDGSPSLRDLGTELAVAVAEGRHELVGLHVAAPERVIAAPSREDHPLLRKRHPNPAGRRGERRPDVDSVGTEITGGLVVAAHGELERTRVV